MYYGLGSARSVVAMLTRVCSLMFLLLALAASIGCDKSNPVAVDSTAQASHSDPLEVEIEQLLRELERSAPLASNGGTQVQDHTSDVATAWMTLAYDVVKAERITPPPASRIYGYAGITLYQSLVSGMSGFKSLEGQLNGFRRQPRCQTTDLYWPEVASSALATLLPALLENESAATTDAINALALRFTNEALAAVPVGTVNRSRAYGRLIALGMIGYANWDGYSRFNNCPFTSPSWEGGWVPTPPGFAPALQPCWGFLRGFALPKQDICDPGPFPTYSTENGSEFFAEAMECYNVTNNLTEEQRTIANFWADGPGATGTPPGHSIKITTQIVQNRALNLAEAAEAFAKVGVAVGDAFISCWNAKYKYNLLRPVTYIQNTIDASWLPPLNTPNFPEYTSGHSVQTGATVATLIALFGDMSFTDNTHADRGFAPRSFVSLNDLANEAAFSRLYGGIHFRAGIIYGVSQGTCVGGYAAGLVTREPVN